MTPLVDHQIADFDPFAVGLGREAAAASQQSLDAILEFARAERLRQIIVGAGLEPGDFI